MWVEQLIVTLYLKSCEIVIFSLRISLRIKRQLIVLDCFVTSVLSGNACVMNYKIY